MSIYIHFIITPCNVIVHLTHNARAYPCWVGEWRCWVVMGSLDLYFPCKDAPVAPGRQYPTGPPRYCVHSTCTSTACKKDMAFSLTISIAVPQYPVNRAKRGESLGTQTQSPSKSKTGRTNVTWEASAFAKSHQVSDCIFRGWE